MRPIAVDFETEAIEPRPHYPPKPVGCALRLPGKEPQYLAWGHPTGNNCTQEQARKLLAKVWANRNGLLCHNLKFDIDVAETHLGLKPPPAEVLHDTMLLAYLFDPHNRALGLKELAVQYLDQPATERDELRDWIIANVPEARRAKTKWGAYIARAPGDLVGRYAKGDVTRTEDLFAKLMPLVREAGMYDAYSRELKLIPILLDNERRGVRVDLPRLESEVAKYDKVLEDADAAIRKSLKSPELNIDSNKELADALERAGIVAEGDWLITPTGERSTSKKSLQGAVKDSRMVALLEYRASLATCLTTFMRPWLAVARETNGWMHTNWSSIKQEKGGGTRTGRLSSSPNFQNIYTDENLEKAEKALLALKYKLPPLPRVRSYIVADSDKDLLIDRDFKQQELRVLAHFEDGNMQRAYLENPDLDLHDYATDIILRETGLHLDRKATKIIAFGLLYGMGVGNMAMRLGVEVDKAANARKAYLRTFPGVKDLMDDLKQLSRLDSPMKTWGGRMYYAEPSKMIDGQLRDFAYKLLNYLIQGSSADITKEAILRYNEQRRDSRLILTVHDEVMACTPKKVWRREMRTLKECMNSIELDVPLLSDGKYGERWYDMAECD